MEKKVKNIPWAFDFYLLVSGSMHVHLARKLWFASSNKATLWERTTALANDDI